MKYLVLIALVLSLFGGLSTQKAYAEPGCSTWGDVYTSGSTIYGYGVYDCGNDSAPNNRQLQVCIQRLSYGNVLCHYAGSLGNNYYRLSPSESCAWGADLSTYQVWIWFYGEDGSQTNTYSRRINSYLRCT